MTHILTDVAFLHKPLVELGTLLALHYYTTFTPVSTVNIEIVIDRLWSPSFLTFQVVHVLLVCGVITYPDRDRISVTGGGVFWHV